MILWRPTRPFTTNTQKRCPFHYRGRECKSRKSRNTWVTGKYGLGVQNEAEQRLTEFCQENALVIANTLFQQHQRRLHMDITRWSTPKSDWLYSLQPKMEKFYTVIKNKTRSWLWLRSWTPYEKFWLKLKKVGKTTRPFICDLNQILYDYTVEVTNRSRD